ncbi:flagellar hook protein FlgE [Falsirhodobacter algicola]|uniref:Flagellar hook protein FlgE n=1 Tax=Falsirhodobacter algicola TaxID=2692330 RepID=A0A8J8MT52_9RHOB|nr:flagellar hook-basal body complex protein [Falsirhodobacter algicola]QUS36009.1 flagellar hook-basal body complex protein [Falsirhodobacter algicola]
MTISSSLNAGVSGLNANAARLASISDNIANSGTYGYKRAETDFFQMVNAGNDGVSYSAGGVRTSALRLVDERGALTSSSNATDIAIDGRGFLPVSSDDGDSVVLTTTGSFRQDASGVLRTTSGLALMGWPAQADGTIPAAARESMEALRPVTVSANAVSANPTTQMSMALNLPATDTRAGAEGQVRTQTMEYFDTLGTSQLLTADFTPTVPAEGASNSWRMTLTDGATGSVVGSYRLSFDGQDGTLSDVTTLSGGTWDAQTGAIGLTLSGADVRFDIGKAGQMNGMTQLSDSFLPTSIQKDGSGIGSLTSVDIDAQGQVRAFYDQGFSRVIFQVPVVDVPNPNGLTSLGDQTYALSPEAGAFYLWDAGDGPTGTTQGYTREESATDVAQELTNLIQTQHAYSSNAKIIQTVDEMLSETTNLKR